MGVLDHVNLHLVRNMDDLFAFKRWVGERRAGEVMGVDTETGGFSPESNRLRLVQFGDLNTGWAIPYELWGGASLEVISSYDKPIVLHNSKFDARFITHHGNIKWPWHLTNDTMTMAHLIDPLRPKGLKPLSGMLIDTKAANAQSLLSQGMSEHKWTWDTVPIDYTFYWVYAAMDPVLTCHIYAKLKDEIMGSYRNVYDLEMGVTRVITDMEARGARVDLDYCSRTSQALTTWVHDAKQWLSDTYGLHRPTDMALLKFFNDNNIPMLHKMTSSGSRQALDKEVLLSIDHDVARTILNIRKAEKTTGPYFSNFLTMADSDSYVHPNVWTMGTRTARMSITAPALQTLPRKDPLVRTAFIPSEGNSLITCDYDQIEARLTAHFSGDQGLINAFLGPDDFFCTIASQIYSTPITKKDPRRQLTKNCIYGKIYGAGPAKMAETARVPVEVMEEFTHKLDSIYPGILGMQKSIGLAARRNVAQTGRAFINTPMGRRLVADDNKDYTLMNYLIQSHAAEILKKKIVELDAVLPGRMILPVHDELVFDVPKEDGPELQRLIEETMCDRESYAVPITASSDLLEENWGTKYK